MRLGVDGGSRDELGQRRPRPREVGGAASDMAVAEETDPVRDAQIELVPYMFVVGNREVENETVALRDRREGDLGAMSVDQAIERLQAEISSRTVR